MNSGRILKNLLLLIFLLLTENSSVSPQTGAQSDRDFNQDVADRIARGVLKLAQDLGAKILEESDEKFEVFSPTSIAGALSLALLGSKGSTHQEIQKIFGFDSDPIFSKNSHKFHDEFSLMLEDLEAANPKHHRTRASWREIFAAAAAQNDTNLKPFDEHLISVANGIFLNYGFTLRPDYKTAVESIYRSNIQYLDFSNNPTVAVKYINDWVSYKTQGKIPKILQNALGSQVRMILVSALYFKALWEYPFLEGFSRMNDFFPNGLQEPPVQVELMAHGRNFPFINSKELDLRILGLPYKRNQTTMYIILPNNSNRQKLIEIQKRLTPANIEDLISQMKSEHTIVLFPKLHLNSRLQLSEKLKKLGVNSLFQPRTSDLSLVSDAGSLPDTQDDDEKFIWTRFGESTTPQSLLNLDVLREKTNLINPGLYVDEAIHQVDLVVNEKGTVAGAASAFSIAKTTMNIFRVDVPFLFLIRHDPTKLVLFYGAVFEPVNSPE